MNTKIILRNFSHPLLFFVANTFALSVVFTNVARAQLNRAVYHSCNTYEVKNDFRKILKEIFSPPLFGGEGF